VFSLVAIVLLGSYLAGVPIGPAVLYSVELVRGEAIDATGRSLGDEWRKCYLPSMLLLSGLLLNACVAGIGIHLSRKRRKNRAARTSSAALVLSTVAFVLVWTLWILAAT
jgi:hypothetical protein